MEGLLEGRVAIVTGAGRGIGRAHALALADAGACVVVNDVGVEADGTNPSHEPADEVVEEIRKGGGEARANYDSVANWDAAEQLVQAAVDHFGGLDIVVNNAGLSHHADLIEEMTEENYDLVVDSNLKGTFAVCRHAIPMLKRRDYGRIINTASNMWAAPHGDAPYALCPQLIIATPS